MRHHTEDDDNVESAWSCYAR